MRVTAVEMKTRANAESVGFKMVRSDQEKYSRALFDLEMGGKKVSRGLTCEQINAVSDVLSHLPDQSKTTASSNKRNTRKAA